MKGEKVITSARNGHILDVLELMEKSRARRMQKLFVVEGFRELNLAVSAGYTIESLFVCEGLGSVELFVDSLPAVKRIFTVSGEVFAKLAYRENSDGLVAVMHARSLSLENVRLSDNPFIIMLEAIEKPGNLGAILRTADAANVDAVIIFDAHTDLYNPNVIRSGIGCLFTQQVVTCSSQEALHWLRAKKIKTYAAELEASQWYHETDFREPSAIIMGTEADGLTDFWLERADARIKIPMRGKIDSLNVSVSTAVITFEAMRQRGF